MDRDTSGEDGRQRRGPGWLQHLLHPLDGEAHPGQDRRIVEQDDVVEVPLAHRQRPDPRERRPEPVRDTVRLDAHDRVPFQRDRHRVRPLRLDAIDAKARLALLECGRDTGDQSPATDTDDHDIEVRQVVEEFETDGAVPGDDRGVVERVDELESLLVPHPLHLRERLADVRAMEDDTRPVAQAGLHLGADGPDLHDHGDRDAGRAPGPCIRLTGIPGRQGDDAARSRPVRQRSDPVDRPARLEGPGLLEMLRFEVQPIIPEAHTGRDGRPGCRRG